MLKFLPIANAILKFPDNDPIMLRNGPIMLMVLAIILVKSSVIDKKCLTE